MTNLQNVVVFIKDEAMLEEAREMLSKHNEQIAPDYLFNFNIKKKNYLLSHKSNYTWHVTNDILKVVQLNPHSLTELEQLIKGQNENQDK